MRAPRPTNIAYGMNIDNHLVDQLADLAKLEFSNPEKEQIKDDLGRILDMIHKLDELDTEGLEPLKYLNLRKDYLREDAVEQNWTKEEALKNAPDKDSDYIRVPKVFKK